ncbi:hypothetical protein BJ912DRAFT_543121, partial [Pholiota molesta]
AADSQEESNPSFCEEENGDFTQANTSWEDSLEKVLRAFKDAEAEDSDLRDLFYRDSSFFSQSSLISGILGLPRYSNISSGSGGRHDERLKRLDESFDSVEKSVEELLAELELLPDTITIKTEDPYVEFFIHRRWFHTRIMDEVVKPGPELVRLITSIPEDDEDGEEPYTWTATSQDEEKRMGSQARARTTNGVIFLDWNHMRTELLQITKSRLFFSSWCVPLFQLLFRSFTIFIEQETFSAGTSCPRDRYDYENDITGSSG